MATNHPVLKVNDFLFSEAPASWNTRYIDPSGFECQITLRGETGQDLLERAASAVAYLLKNGCTPYSYSRSSTRPVESKPEEPKGGNGNGGGSSFCPIHQCEMKRWEKDDRVWYAHKVNGEWCRGK